MIDPDVKNLQYYPVEKFLLLSKVGSKMNLIIYADVESFHLSMNQLSGLARWQLLKNPVVITHMH